MKQVIIIIAALWFVSYLVMLKSSMKENSPKWTTWFPAVVVAEQIALAAAMIIYIAMSV